MTDETINAPRVKFTPEFSLGNLVAIIAIIGSTVSVTLYIGSIEKIIAANMVRIAYTEDRLNRESSITMEIKRDNTARLDRIENKLDDLQRTIQSNQRGWRQ